MTKKCFVLMPISDTEGYAPGHFKRVYEHIIKPACVKAGFKPIRADDIVTTNYIALDILRNIIECEMALCDLSSRNPNVLYELGVRQAFNKPVTLLKDSKTARIFDIQGFRDLEYDESLRIDNVELTVDTLSELILNTYENDSKEVNSLISMLGIQPAKIPENRSISAETEIILSNLRDINSRLNKIEDRSLTRVIKEVDHVRPINLRLNPLLQLEPGTKLSHPDLGIVTIVSVDRLNKLIEVKTKNQDKLFYHLHDDSTMGFKLVESKD